MKVVLDTHILLWWMGNDRRLSSKARRLIENQSNSVAVSATSMWEIAIKRALGRIRIDLKELEDAIVANNFEPMAVKLQHAIEVSVLPQHHRDPFDRMLIAQCITEKAHLLTQDEALHKYGKVVMVV